MCFFVSLSNNREALQRFFVYSEPETRRVLVEVDVPVLWNWLAVKDVPEEFVTDLDIYLGKEFRDRGVKACHTYMVVVHLTSVRNDRDLERFSQRTDLSRLADATHAIGIKLDVIEGIIFQ